MRGMWKRGGSEGWGRERGMRVWGSSTGLLVLLSAARIREDSDSAA